MTVHYAPTAPGQRHTASRLSHLLAIAGLCLAVTACTSSTKHSSPTPSANSAPTQRLGPAPGSSDNSEEPQTARTFKATRQPCALIDQKSVGRVLGPDGGNLTAPRTDERGGFTFMTCNRKYGTPSGSQTIFSLRMNLADPIAVKGQYEGIRRSHSRQFPLTDVAGVGQGAYTYTDPDIGQNLTAYDGNLYLELVVNPVAGPAAPTAEVLPMMIDTTKHAMAGLSQ